MKQVMDDIGMERMSISLPRFRWGCDAFCSPSQPKYRDSFGTSTCEDSDGSWRGLKELAVW